MGSARPESTDNKAVAEMVHRVSESIPRVPNVTAGRSHEPSEPGARNSVDSRDYLRALRRFWPVMAVCLIVGLVAAEIYNNSTYLDQANASVAVLSPLVSGKASGSTEAQVSFDAIVKSNTLAALVAQRMHEKPDDVSNNLSVTIDSGAGSASSALTSPLYIVHGKDKGLDQAKKLVNIAIEEASTLYFKINATDGSDLKAAIAAQRQVVAGDVLSAQGALDKFGIANRAVDLPNRIQQQRGVVSQLTLQVYDASAGSGGTYGALARALSKEKDELNRLSNLLPEYGKLQFEVTAAQARESEFDAQNQILLINTLLPSEVQVKILDPAAEESQLLYLLLVFGLGAVSGLILGIASIYILGLIYRRPATAEEVAQALGAPILVRIPRTAG
jgi:uncharacterized protein involved in exopolysaccharide biosynthesis